MESKYIHYCWFGDKPLPKLAKKCIKSWKKYLPDYEVICWNESNVDLDECAFVREAYDNKKWAFVADYARSKAMYEMGGIYFDTDMKIIKPIDFLLDKETFIGVEDSGKVACGVWGEKHPNSHISSYLLKYYLSKESFDIKNIFNFSIPKLITDSLQVFNYNEFDNKIQILNNNIYIYPREYFYPYSYDRENNFFTDNTCMIHYYDASWVPKGEKKTVKLIRQVGRKNAYRIINFKQRTKKLIVKIVKIVGFPAYTIYKKNKNKEFFKKRIVEFNNLLEKHSEKEYVVFYNKVWLGTMYSTKEVFENTISFHEIYEGDRISEYAKSIVDKKFRMIIFSSFSIGWDQLIEEIRKIDKDVCIKIFWHGSNAMHGEDYDWAMFYSIMKLLKKGDVNSIGFAKKSMYEFYKLKGYSVEFVMNNISLNKEKYYSEIPEREKRIYIGLYASGNRWVKNFYNQFAGASLVKNSIIDCVPLTQRIKEFANILNVKFSGSTLNLDREILFKRMMHNDINIYCTFVECAPLLPLESMELGVPCITGNNHHYWEGTELEKYLVVDQVDNSYQICKKIEFCLKNRKKIMRLYDEWKKEYNIAVKRNNEKFLKISKKMGMKKYE